MIFFNFAIFRKMANKAKSSKHSSPSTRVSFSSLSSKEAKEMVKKVRNKYRQRMDDIEQWEEKVEKKKRGIAEQKIWIEDWMRRRENFEKLLIRKKGGKIFSKMKQELKKLKTEMEQMQDEILRETANISQ